MARATKFSDLATTDGGGVSGNALYTVTSGYKVQASMFSNVA